MAGAAVVVQVTQLERLRADHARLVAHLNKQKSYIEVGTW